MESQADHSSQSSVWMGLSEKENLSTKARVGEGGQEDQIRERDGKEGRTGGAANGTCVFGLRNEQVLVSGAFVCLLP